MSSLSLRERFHQTLPLWLEEVKEEAYQRIASCRLITACYQGERHIIKAKLITYWPFVKVFPEIIHRCGAQLLRKFTQTDKADLIGISREILVSMRQDESDHRELWVKTSKAVGLSHADLGVSPLPSVQRIIDTVGQNDNLGVVFLRFVAVELVAESVSRRLLESEHFKTFVGEAGLSWYEIHTRVYPGMTHEEIAYRLAFLLLEDTSREYVRPIILDIIDQFTAAGDAACDLLSTP